MLTQARLTFGRQQQLVKDGWTSRANFDEAKQKLESVQGQIEANRLIGRAKRILVERHGISDQEAFRRLNTQALANSRTLREIAEAILLTEDMAMPVDSARKK